MKCMSRQGLVKRGIENCHLLFVRKQFGCNADALGTCRVVQWCQIRKLLDSFHHAFSDQSRTTKVFSTVNDTVPDGFYLQFFAPAEELDDA